MSAELLKLFGVSKEEAAARIAQVIPWDCGVKVEFQEREPELHLLLSAPPEREEVFSGVLRLVTEKLGLDLFATGEGTMDSVLAALFRTTGATLSLAESCTGGLIAARITEEAGSSAWFLQGAVTYSNAAKTRLLGVPPELLKEHGAVSSEVAIAMARGARENCGSDLALAVTGIAGPEGGSPLKPVGTVFVASDDREGSLCTRYLFPGGRREVRELTVCTALDLLRRRLLTLYRTDLRG